MFRRGVAVTGQDQQPDDVLIWSCRRQKLIGETFGTAVAVPEVFFYRGASTEVSIIVNLFVIAFAGIVLLYAGGEMLVRYSSSLGCRMGLSDLFIGLTIVAFGTSAPELVSSIVSIIKNAPDLVMGNILGSNITNIGLILALSAVISPFDTDFARNRDNFLFLATASILAGLIIFTGHIYLWEGLVLLVMFGFYNWTLFRAETSPALESEENSVNSDTSGILLPLIGIAISVVMLPFGADLLVDSAVGIGSLLGVSQHVMGLTLVAMGTSLPELVTSLIAAFRKKGDLCLGNIVGSNIFNILVIPGVCSVFGPMNFPSVLLRTDVLVMVGMSLVAILFTFSGNNLSRREGTFLLCCYCGYMLQFVR